MFAYLNKSIFSINVNSDMVWSLGSVLVFINIMVFSNPVLGTESPESGGISFAATWISLIFYFTSEGKRASNLAGVWIGGTPASCKIKLLFHFSSLIKKLYLSSVKTPFSNIAFNPFGS